MSAPEEEPVAVKKKILFKKPPTEASAVQAGKEEVKPAWSSEQDLICPATKSTAFARMPAISIRGGVALPAGDIVLRYGAHYGYNNGFGFQHIWREHFHHIKDHDSAMEAVIERLSSILLSGTNIFYDAGNRASLFRLHVGLVIVELRTGKPPHYSIVTGGYNPPNTKGSLVGALV